MEGNPTQSMQVNSLIKRVRKKEARKQGVKSQNRRPILDDEFVALHELLNQHDDGVVGVGACSRRRCRCGIESDYADGGSGVRQSWSSVY